MFRKIEMAVCTIATYTFPSEKIATYAEVPVPFSLNYPHLVVDQISETVKIQRQLLIGFSLEWIIA